MNDTTITDGVVPMLREAPAPGETLRAPGDAMRAPDSNMIPREPAPCKSLDALDLDALWLIDLAALAGMKRAPADEIGVTEELLDSALPEVECRRGLNGHREWLVSGIAERLPVVLRRYERRMPPEGV